MTSRDLHTHCNVTQCMNGYVHSLPTLNCLMATHIHDPHHQNNQACVIIVQNIREIRPHYVFMGHTHLPSPCKLLHTIKLIDRAWMWTSVIYPCVRWINTCALSRISINRLYKLIHGAINHRLCHLQTWQRLRWLSFWEPINNKNKWDPGPTPTLAI